MAPYLRDVRRIPLKPQGKNEDETNHLSMSSDGIRFFHPVTLHQHNCQSTRGLLHVVAELNKLYEFTDPKNDKYSILNIDVSLYNMLFHTVYSFSGLQPFLDKVFVLFGIWHCYMYAHVALWDRFRCTFLADAFFAFISEDDFIAQTCSI